MGHLVLDAQQIREMFARYGAAMYHAQCVEKSLVILVSSVFNKQFLSSHPDIREKFHNQAFSKTLGRLIKELEVKVTIPPDLRKELNDALQKRNWLTHDYFYERAGDMLTLDGRDRMIRELSQLSDYFSAIDAQLTSIMERWAEKVGITSEVIDEELKKLVQRAENFSQ